MVQRTKVTSLTDVGPLWGLDSAALARAGDQFRTWLEAGEAIQRHAIEYVTSRMTKDSEALARLASCKTPLELLQAQSDYTRDAFGDFVTNGRRMAACVEQAAHKGTSGT